MLGECGDFLKGEIVTKTSLYPTLYNRRTRWVPQHSTPCRADPGVAMMLDHLPATPLSDLPEFAKLVFDRLLVGGHADVNRSPFWRDAKRPLAP